ncbi:unnamed protein product [Urochloa humidicola]
MEQLGSRHSSEGKLVSKDKRAEHVVKRIKEVREEVASGSFVPDRENDVLTRALGNKEHYGRVRGFGLVPWELGFSEFADSYRSRARSKAQQQAVFQDLLQTVRDEMEASNAKLRESLREEILEQTMSQRPPIATADGGHIITSPVVPRSSCGSNVHPVEDPNERFPVDEITEPKPCKLYVMAGFIKTKVAIGLAQPTKEKEVLHCRELPVGFARVTLDALVKKSFGVVELEIPGQDDKVKLRDNLGCFVAWRKRYISFADTDSDSDDDENTYPTERVPSQPSPQMDRSPPRKEPTPPPREPTPPPREPTPPPRPSRRSLLSKLAQSPGKTRASHKRRPTQSSPPQEKTRKKPMSGSIRSLIPDVEDVEIPKEAVEHFQKMCLVPQTGSNKPPKTDFERISSKRSMLEFSKNEDGLLLPTPKLAWTFELGKDLVSPEEIHGLPMKMRNLHAWYKSQSGLYFGVRYPKEFFGQPIDLTTHSEKWIKFEFLFELYQQDSLDVNIIFLWCLMESHILKKREIEDIAFLDPVSVNEKTLLDPGTAHYLYHAFCKLKMKKSILLAYNCS